MRKWLVLAVMLLCAGVVHADVTLVNNGASNYEIVRADDSAQSVQYAAQELQKFIAQSTSVTLPIVSTPSEGRGHIFLGANPVSEQAGVTPDDLKPEGFHLRVVGQDIHIVGRDTAGNAMRVTGWDPVQCGTLYGAYELLERYLGVMFCWGNDLGTVVPQHSEVVIPAANITQAPDFDYRIISYLDNGAAGGVYGRRLRLGTQQEISMGQFAYTFMDKYADSHPEYFALVNGKRITRHAWEGGGMQPCTSNPDVIRIFAETAIQHFKDSPVSTIFSISLNDGGEFCECDNCRALDLGGMIPGTNIPVMTDRILHFYDAVAEQVAKVYPDKKLGGLVYSYYQDPPQREKVAPNLILFHATNSMCVQGLGWPRESDIERQWVKLTPNLYKYDIPYYSPQALGLIAPVTSHMIERLRDEHANGLRGAYYEYATSYEQTGVGQYLLARLMWDKNADARAVEKQYYNALYGTAGPDVLAYYTLLDNRLQQMYTKGVDVDDPAVKQMLGQKIGDSGSAGYMVAAYWPILDQADALIKQAQGRQLSDLEQQRLVRLVDQHELMLGTIRGMIAAGRIETQAQAGADDKAMLKSAVELREAAEKRIAAYDPWQGVALAKSDKNETSKVSSEGAFYQMSTRTHAQRLVAVQTATPPLLDGSENDAVWQSAPKHYFMLAASGAQPSAGAYARLVFDDRKMYVLVKGHEEDPAKLRAETRDHDNTMVFGDDDVELFIQPPGSTTYYQIAVGAGGGIYDAAYPNANPQQPDLTWESGAVVKTAAGPHDFTYEIAIPISAFGAPPLGEWRANICRSRIGNASPAEYTAVIATFGGYHVPSHFAPLVISDGSDQPGFDCPAMDSLTTEDAIKALKIAAIGGATAEIVSDRAFYGSKSLHIKVPEGANGEDCLGQITVTAKAKPSMGYRALVTHFNHVTGYNAVTSKQAPITRVIFRKADGNSATESSGYSWSGTPADEKPDQWRMSPHVFTTTADTDSISLSVFFFHPGDYWVDDLRLEEW